MPRLVLSLCFLIAALYGFCPFCSWSSFTAGIFPSIISCCLQRPFCNFISKMHINNSKQYHIEKPSFCSNMGEYECCFYMYSRAVLSPVQLYRQWERGNNEGTALFWVWLFSSVRLFFNHLNSCPSAFIPFAYCNWDNSKHYWRRAMDGMWQVQHIHQVKVSCCRYSLWNYWITHTVCINSQWQVDGIGKMQHLENQRTLSEWIVCS